MKVIFTIVFTAAYVHSAFCAKPAWLFAEQYCLSGELSQTIHLTENGASSSITLSLTRGSSAYLPGSNCSITVEAPEPQYLSLTFEEIDTASCGQDFDSIFVQSPSSNTTLHGSHSCPNSDCPEYTFQNTPTVKVDFQSTCPDAQLDKHTGFHATVTAYSQAVKPKLCLGNDRFTCANSHCIWVGFHCDGHNHCGDNSDEPPGCAKTVWGVLVIVLGVLSVCFFLPLFCYLAIWGPRRKVPIRIMGNTFFTSNASSAINDEEAEVTPILVAQQQPLHGSMPGETFTFYYGTNNSNHPRC